MPRFYVETWETNEDYDSGKPGVVVVVNAKDESDAEHRADACEGRPETIECIGEVPKSVTNASLLTAGFALVGFPKRRAAR